MASKLVGEEYKDLLNQKSPEELFDLLEPYIKNLVMNLISEVQENNQNTRNMLAVISQKINQQESKVETCLANQEAISKEQVELAKTAQEAVEILRGLQESLPDEIGRAQDLAQQALDKANETKPIINNIKYDGGGDRVMWDGGNSQTYDYGISSTPQNPLKDMLAHLQSPNLTVRAGATMAAPLSYRVLSQAQYDHLKDTIPAPEDCARKLDNLMNQTNGVISMLEVEKMSGGVGYKVNATSDEREVSLDYDIITKTWKLGSIQELQQLPSVTTATVTTTKPKKKRSKNNANSISK